MYRVVHQNGLIYIERKVGWSASCFLIYKDYFSQILYFWFDALKWDESHGTDTRYTIFVAPGFSFKLLAIFPLVQNCIAREDETPEKETSSTQIPRGTTNHAVPGVPLYALSDEFQIKIYRAFKKRLSAFYPPIELPSRDFTVEFLE